MTELLHQQTEFSEEALEIAKFQDELSDVKKEIGKEAEKQESIVCPFPNHKGYSEVWEKLTPDQQKYMKENIAITADGKIEIVKMHKKFSVLTTKPNDKNILDGSHKDKNGKTGIQGLIYFTGRAAEQECKKQGKKLLSGREEVEQFIDFFPRIGEAPKIEVIGELLGLEMSGYFYAKEKKWRGVGSICTIGMSKVNDEYNSVFEITRGDGNAYVFREAQDDLLTFFVYEDIKAEQQLDGIYMPDTNKSGTFTMPNGKTYSYEELIKDFPRLKDENIFKANFPGREIPGKK